MAVAQTIINTGKYKTGKDRSRVLSKNIHRYAEHYAGARVVFDIYTNPTSSSQSEIIMHHQEGT